jgi:hypothetical protein
MEFEELESDGDAGAVVEESEGALGAADCCFEQATIASALKHNKRRLRFIDHLTVYLVYQVYPAHLALPGGTQRLDASSVPSQQCFPPGKLQATATSPAPDMLRAFAVLLGEVA